MGGGHTICIIGGASFEVDGHLRGTRPCFISYYSMFYPIFSQIIPYHPIVSHVSSQIFSSYLIFIWYNLMVSSHIFIYFPCFLPDFQRFSPPTGGSAGRAWWPTWAPWGRCPVASAAPRSRRRSRAMRWAGASWIQAMRRSWDDD